MRQKPNDSNALTLKPGDPDIMYGIMVAHYKSGEAAEKEGKMDEAKQYCGKCIDVGNELIRIDANRPEAWQVRGYCKRIVGDTAGAAVDLKRFTELRSQSSSRSAARVPCAVPAACGVRWWCAREALPLPRWHGVCSLAGEDPRERRMRSCA